MMERWGLEYFRAFPFIDHVVVGEGEVAFPALWSRQVLAGRVQTVSAGSRVSAGRQRSG